MKAVVLAAGQGSRLRPLTDELPKTLLPVGDGITILDTVLANLAGHGVRDVVLVTGFAADRVLRAAADLRTRHDVRLSFVHNDRGSTWNNAYSLWLATELMDDDTLLVNSDTLHPPSVLQGLFDAATTDSGEIVLAVDEVKSLGEEEMKVTVDSRGAVTRIHKAVDPAAAFGEYIGVCLVRARVVAELRSCLQRVWERDPHLYYEDGFQLLVDGGVTIGLAEIGEVDWIEVDTVDDLMAARRIIAKRSHGAASGLP